MAGMCPCGMIVLLSELFISESLPQVYGSLHQFYASNPAAASRISKYTSTVLSGNTVKDIVYKICLL